MANLRAARPPISDLIFVADWAFCKEHGSEFCNHCGQDQRVFNDMKLHPDEEFMKLSAKSAERPALNVFKLGAERSSNKAEDGDYKFKCKKHGTDDCPSCFNFKKALEAATAKKEDGKVGDVTMIKALLKSLGVDMSESKMKAAGLEAKLQSALRKVQNLDGLELPLSLAGCGKYTPRHKGQHPLGNDFVPQSLAELQARMAAMAGGGSRSADIFENAFTDARQSLLQIATYFTQGRPWAILQTPDDTEALGLRVVEVKSLAGPDGPIPILTLLFAMGTSSQPLTQNPMVPWMQGILKETKAKEMPFVTLKSSHEELALVKKILHLNASRISADYKPKRKPTEKAFALSFFVPLQSLSYQDAGRIASSSGCSLCGKTASLSCSACKTVRYCSSGCQAQHWPDHKVFCGKLKSAVWHKMPINTNIGLPPGVNVGMNLDVSKGVEQFSFKPQVQPEQNDIAPNKHGSSVFMVKLSRPTGDPSLRLTSQIWPGAMLIYDLERSFRAYLERPMAPAFYDACLKEIMSGKVQNLKAYRLAKRTGDRELSVCLSVPIEPEPTW